VTDDARVKRITLVAAILGSGVVFLDGTVVNVALPAIVDELDAGFVAQQWIVEGYLLTLGALLLVGGSLGDILGRKRIFMTGLVGFGVTSLICAVAPSSEALIAARTLQGMAGALLVPASLAMITATFPASERGAAIGSWTAWTGIAFVVGPLGGGAIVEYVSWRWIFAINVPLVLLTLAIARSAQESFDEQVSRRIDYLGALLVSFGLAGPVFALIEQQNYGWGDPLVYIPFVAGIVLLGLFVAHESRTDHPMLPLGLFRSRNFSVGNLSTLGIYGGLGAATFFATIFLQQVAGYSPIAAGLALMPITIVMWLLSSRFGRLSDRIGPRLLMGLGPIVAGIGLIWMGRLGSDVNYWTDLLPGVLVFSLGLSATVAPLTTTVLGSVPEHNAGVASGVNNQVSRVAGLLAIAVLGAVVAARFEDVLDTRTAPLPPAAQAAADDARPLSGGVKGRPALDRPVEEASVSAYRAGMAVGGGLVIVGGVISLLGIANPRRREISAPAEPERARAYATPAAGPCPPVEDEQGRSSPAVHT
jgi:EmrB/QacA subfamily drug resistance transporter